jgi:opacity protein-like surface antigen|tara:strand:- start:251 stop:937 length:687 start_codon:yes stop_codon:yes gene_type:complete
MKRLIIAITSVFMLFANSAMSMDLRPAVGISGNMGVYAATGIENNFNNTGTTIDETTKEYGAFATEYGSIFLELGLNDTISIGVDYVPAAIETPKNISNDGVTGATKPDGSTANQNSVKAEFEDLTTIYAKVNIPLGGTYLKVGYTQADVVSIESMSSGNTYGNDTTSGYTLGLGYDHEVVGGLSVRAEVTGSDFSDVSANNGQTNKTEIKVKDMIGVRGTISLVKSF